MYMYKEQNGKVECYKSLFSVVALSFLTWIQKAQHHSFEDYMNVFISAEWFTGGYLEIKENNLKEALSFYYKLWCTMADLCYHFVLSRLKGAIPRKREKKNMAKRYFVVFSRSLVCRGETEPWHKQATVGMRGLELPNMKFAFLWSFIMEKTVVQC